MLGDLRFSQLPCSDTILLGCDAMSLGQ